MPQKLKSSALAAGKLWHRFPGQSDEKIRPEPPGGQSPALPFPQPSCALTGGEGAGQQLLVSYIMCFVPTSQDWSDPHLITVKSACWQGRQQHLFLCAKVFTSMNVESGNYLKLSNPEYSGENSSVLSAIFSNNFYYTHTTKGQQEPEPSFFPWILNY